MTTYGFILAIMDMASAKSDVNGPKKQVKKRIDQNYFKLKLSCNKFKNGFCHN